MIVCRTLGPVQAILQDGSAPADLQWAKNLALLVYLARSPEGTRTREHLIGLLWGDKPESKARQSLNTALSLHPSANASDLIDFVQNANFTRAQGDTGNSAQEEGKSSQSCQQQE